MSLQTPPSAPQVAGALLLDASQRRKLLGYARSRFGIGTEDAEDLLQDTLLELLRKRIQVRSPEAFVFTMFRTCCVRHVEASRLRSEIFSQEAVPPEAHPHPAGPGGMDRRVALRQALEGISSACRRLLCAFYIEGQSLREAAYTLDATQFGVSKTINRCLKRLRQCLS